MTRYTELQPHFDGEAWTGSNLTAIQEFVNRHVGPSDNREYRVLTEQDGAAGALRIDERGVIQLVVSVGETILRGPIYGTNAEAAGWQVLAPAELAVRYEVDAG